MPQAIKWSQIPQKKFVATTSAGGTSDTLQIKVPPGKIWRILNARVTNDSRPFRIVHITGKDKDDEPNHVTIGAGPMMPDNGWNRFEVHPKEVYVTYSVWARVQYQESGDVAQLFIQYLEGNLP